MTKSYPTRLINDRRKPVDVYEMDGGVIVRLEAGQVFDIEACLSTTMYARWSEIRFTDDGPRFVSRTDWREPDRGRWTLRMLNQDGKYPFEFRMVGGAEKLIPDPDPFHTIHVIGGPDEAPLVKANIGGQKICLPKGVPVLVGLQATDPLVMYRSLTIIKRRVMLKDAEHEGYIVFDTVTKDETVPRSDAELKALAKIIDGLGKKS